MGDLWLSDADAAIDVDSTLARTAVSLADIPIEGLRQDAGGLDRNITLSPLPDVLHECSMRVSTPITVNPDRDNPLWVRIKTEDGHTTWSSPIYIIPE